MYPTSEQETESDVQRWRGRAPSGALGDSFLTLQLLVLVTRGIAWLAGALPITWLLSGFLLLPGHWSWCVRSHLTPA